VPNSGINDGSEQGAQQTDNPEVETTDGPWGKEYSSIVKAMTAIKQYYNDELGPHHEQWDSEVIGGSVIKIYDSNGQVIREHHYDEDTGMLSYK
jgi:hypothetical protein